jgi:hypothetical protein
VKSESRMREQTEGRNLVLLVKLVNMEFLRDLWLFLKERKKWWLVPLMVLLVLITLFIVLGGSSALAPFIYTLF